MPVPGAQSHLCPWYWLYLWLVSGMYLIIEFPSPLRRVKALIPANRLRSILPNQFGLPLTSRLRLVNIGFCTLLFQKNLHRSMTKNWSWLNQISSCLSQTHTIKKVTSSEWLLIDIPWAFYGSCTTSLVSPKVIVDVFVCVFIVFCVLVWQIGMKLHLPETCTKDKRKRKIAKRLYAERCWTSRQGRLSLYLNNKN